MNDCDLRGLWWSASFQRNTRGLYYELHVALEKCMTTGHNSQKKKKKEIKLVL